MNDPRLFRVCCLLHEAISGTKAYNKRELGKLLKTDSEVGSTNKEYLRCTGIGTLGKMEESVI